MHLQVPQRSRLRIWQEVCLLPSTCLQSSQCSACLDCACIGRIARCCNLDSCEWTCHFNVNQLVVFEPDILTKKLFSPASDTHTSRVGVLKITRVCQGNFVTSKDNKAVKDDWRAFHCQILQLRKQGTLGRVRISHSSIRCPETVTQDRGPILPWVRLSYLIYGDTDAVMVFSNVATSLDSHLHELNPHNKETKMLQNTACCIRLLVSHQKLGSISKIECLVHTSRHEKWWFSMHGKECCTFTSLASLCSFSNKPKFTHTCMRTLHQWDTCVFSLGDHRQHNHKEKNQMPLRLQDRGHTQCRLYRSYSQTGRTECGRGAVDWHLRDTWLCD